jgi:nitroreductase
MDQQFNQQLDELIELRRSVRSFTDEVPPREMIEQILKAGLAAPYAAPAVAGTKVFRRFCVVERGSAVMETLRELALEHIRAFAEMLKEKPGAEAFAGRLEMMAQSGRTPLDLAPYYVVVAEKKGTPAAELQSLAHVLENMWLKATALGIGFFLISLTERMGQDPEFCRVLGLPEGEFACDGCGIGYATEWPPAAPRPSLDEALTWIS